MQEFCPISGETAQEERLNYLTHLSGLILSFVGWIILLIYAHQSPDGWYTLSAWIYGASLVCLYAASTFYHCCKKVERKYLFRIFDHVCIYLLITGSFVPFAIGPLRDAGGIELLAIEVIIMLAGIITKIFYVDRFPKLSLAFYLGMGWLGSLSFPAMLELLPLSSLIWVIAGGLSYTFGTIFYAWDKIPFNHAIWHLFVIGGSACHYFSIFIVVQQSLI